jgi:anti-anti-sigma factor
LLALTAGGHREVVADLRGSTFMDSTGLHALLRLRERARGCRMVLHLVPSASPVVRTVFELAGVADAFDWVETE